MRVRQPDVQRHHARLDAEAEEGAGKGDRRPQRRQLGRAHLVEGETAAEGGEHAEGQQDHQGADVGEQQVEEGGVAVGGVLVLIHHQKISGKRHHFPEDHEHQGVVGEQHHLHAEHEERGEHPERRQGLGRRAARELARVAGAVERNRDHQRAEQHEEKAGERIDPQMPVEPGQAEREPVGEASDWRAAPSRRRRCWQRRRKTETGTNRSAETPGGGAGKQRYHAGEQGAHHRRISEQ